MLRKKRALQQEKKKKKKKKKTTTLNQNIFLFIVNLGVYCSNLNLFFKNIVIGI